MDTFGALTARTFGFLEDEFGYVRVLNQETPGSMSVEYAKTPLLVSLGWWKGEIDILVQVDITFTKSHEIFRPYISRTFYLSEIVLRQDRSAFSQVHIKPGPIILLQDADMYLSAMALLMHKYCATILAGDLKLLEEITLERRKRA